MSTLLRQLHLEAENIRLALRDIHKRIKVEESRICFEKYHVRINSIVKSPKGKEYKITKIDAHWIGLPWLYGNSRKKDGTFGIVVHSLYKDWILVKS